MQPPIEGVVSNAGGERDGAQDQKHGVKSPEDSSILAVVDAGWCLHLAKNPFA
jgi:hypothetical protein